VERRYSVLGFPADRYEKILDSMMELTASAELVSERLETHRSHRMALESIANAYKSELGDRSAPPPNRRKSMRRETLRTTGSFSGRLSHIDRRESISTTKTEGFEALETLLRRLGISLSSLLDVGETDHGIATTLHEKKHRMLEMVAGLHNGVDLPLAAQLNTVDHAAQLLASALHADSSFGSSLRDGTQERKLTDLEEQIELVRKGIDGVNFEILQRDKAREKFMERWL
jgi:hypothetical protein